MQASKWLSIQVLLDPLELKELMSSLEEFQIFPIGLLVSIGQSFLSKEQMVKEYEKVVCPLKKGDLNISFKRKTFAWTVDKTCVEQMRIEGRCINKVIQPAVLVQWHFMDFSKVDGKFRSNLFGPDTISWGLQFSYPQLFQENFEIKKVDLSFPNTSLFKHLQKWIRQNTEPTPVLIKGKKLRITQRIGKKCFSWVGRHPALQKKAIEVVK